MLLLLLTLIFNIALANEEIKISTTNVPSIDGKSNVELTYISLDKNLLAATITEILQRERVEQVTYTKGNDSQTYNQVKDVLLNEQIQGRELSSRQMNEIAQSNESAVSLTEANNLRFLLVIRSLGLGVSLVVTTGSSLSVAALAGIMNIAMMEYLYIPTRNGRMKGVDFVTSVVEKANRSAQNQNFNMSPQRKRRVEAFANFLTNFSMNFVMLVPFVGMTGADFNDYLRSFVEIETYLRSIQIGVITTLFMGSWKMAMTRWQEIRAQTGRQVVSNKNQSRTINGIDFFLSFVTPGFWNGNILNQTIIVVVGITGYVAYFYYELKDRIVRTRSFAKLFPGVACRAIFAN